MLRAVRGEDDRNETPQLDAYHVRWVFTAMGWVQCIS